ncbi:UNVERIFIED_CONTAM: hypothetical protein GTU68_051816 [Idotea baltica]|nr:hypothetical protein [Idotea baltica]
MLDAFNEIGVKGTILIAEEGINAAIAGTAQQIVSVRAWFESDERFANLWLKESLSERRPFSKMKVRIRPEIITFQPNEPNAVSPALNPAPNMNPAKLKAWLDDSREFTLLDTRNDYEVESGTFAKAPNLNLKTFSRILPALYKTPWQMWSLNVTTRSSHFVQAVFAAKRQRLILLNKASPRFTKLRVAF